MTPARWNQVHDDISRLYARRILKLECPVCHKEFTPIRVGQTRCSAACNYRWHNNLRKVQPTERTCEFCGEKFSVIGFRKFCSKYCYNRNHHLKAHPPKERVKKVKEPKPIKLCVVCGGVVPRGRVRFCSDKCYRKSNKDKWNKKRNRRPKEVKNCINCGKEIESPHRKKYCSDKCTQEYYDKNIRDKEKQKQYAKNNRKKRRKLLTVKLRKRISTRIKGLLKGERHTVNYRNGVITYSEVKLKSHLAKQFKDGMSWDNYGTVWHIDHKIPVSAFNLRCEEDIKRCWELKNLQPMFADENVMKSDKLDKPFQPMLI